MESKDRDDEPDGSCLICNSKTSLSNTTTSKQYFQHPLNPDSFLQDLNTYFLLKHVLGISLEDLQGYLRHCPYPRDWVKVCSLCIENYVDKCAGTFLELQQAQRKYREAREEIIRVVKESVENERESLEPYTLDISQQVRQSVATNSSVPLVENMTEAAGTSKVKIRPSKNCKTNLTSSSDGGSFDVNKYVKVELPESDTPDDLDGDNENFDDDDDKNKRHTRSRTKTSNSAQNVPLEDDDYGCDICSKTFSHSDYLRKHKNECHSDFFHHCTEKGCDFKSRRAHDVTIHIRRHHGSVSDIINLTCPLCSKVFTRKSHLNHHMIHSREHNTKPNLACPQCDKKFTDEVGLKSHQAVVHNIAEFKRHVCAFENCGKGFYRKCHLIEHEASHQGLKCDICDKEFKTTKRLKIHQQMHKTGRSGNFFSCTNCSMRFIRRTDLRRHKMLKHGPRNTHSKIKTLPKVPVIRDEPQVGADTAVADGGAASPLDNCDDQDPLHDEWRVDESDDSVKNRRRRSTRRQALKETTKPTSRPKLKGSPKTGLKFETQADPVILDEAEIGADTAMDMDIGGSSAGDNCDGEDSHDDDWSAGDSESDDDAKKPKRKSTRRKVTTKSPSRVKMDGSPKTRRRRKPIPVFTGEDGKIEVRCEHEGCSAVFPSRSKYKWHLKSKHGPAHEFCCDLCGRSFKKRICFSLHMFRIHGIRHSKVEDNCTCSHCGMVVSNEKVLSRHIQVVHMKEFDFYCELCGKGMWSTLELTRHRVQHHFVCAVEGCEVRCEGQKEIWEHHKQIHNTEIGICSCNECGKLFMGTRQLKNHLLMHEFKRRKQEHQGEGGDGVLGDFVCQLCGQRFPINKYLSHHMSLKHKGVVWGKKKVAAKEEITAE